MLAAAAAATAEVEAATAVFSSHGDAAANAAAAVAEPLLQADAGFSGEILWMVLQGGKLRFLVLGARIL